MHFISITTVLVAALAAAPGALAGINCRGNSLCGSRSASLDGLISTVASFPDSWTFAKGQHIACAKDSVGNSGLCAFTQGNVQGSIGARKAEQLMRDLRGHNCKKCGSVPLSFPINDDGQGILTVNYVGSV